MSNCQNGRCTRELHIAAVILLYSGQKETLGSVANAAVYPPKWGTLKSPAAGQKIVGQVA